MAERDKTTTIVSPFVLPALCAIPVDGLWPLECWLKLDAYDIAATANTELASLNASALRKSDASYDAIIEAGKLQQQLSIIRQDLLERERREHTMDNWFYRILIGLGLIGAAL